MLNSMCLVSLLQKVKESNWLKHLFKTLDQKQKFTLKIGPIMLQPPMLTTLLREKGIALKLPKILKVQKVQLETKGASPPEIPPLHRNRTTRCKLSARGVEAIRPQGPVAGLG